MGKQRIGVWGLKTSATLDESLNVAEPRISPFQSQRSLTSRGVNSPKLMLTEFLRARHYDIYRIPQVSREPSEKGTLSET